jgi:Fic family protein
MALAHYQFEAIHPFADGNGRTGRILNVLLLCAKGLLSSPVLYLSRRIIASKAEYYARLGAVTSTGDWEGWLLYLLTEVEASAQQMIAIIGQIQQANAQLADQLQRRLGRVDADLLTTLMRSPYARIPDVVTGAAVSRPTATNWLKALSEPDGPLRKLKLGRTLLFLNQPLMGALSNQQ